MSTEPESLPVTARIRERRREERLRKIVRHPIRVRILGILLHSSHCTQRELGRQLSLSSAAVHHHLKSLLESDLVRLQGTRPGPNSITEKLYELNREQWSAFVAASEEKNADVDFHLEYVLAWIQERNREGLELLRESEFMAPFVAASSVAVCSYEEIVDLKRQVHDVVARFHEEHQREVDRDHQPYAVMLSILPSREENTEQSRNELEFEPRRIDDIA